MWKRVAAADEPRGAIGTIGILGDHPSLAALLRTVPGRRWRAERLDMLPRDRRAARGLATIIVQLDGHVDDDALSEWIRSTNEQPDRPPVLLLIEWSPVHVRRAFQLGRVGLSGLVIHGFDDPHRAIDRVLRAFDISRAVAQEMTGLGVFVRPAVWESLRRCLERYRSTRIDAVGGPALVESHTPPHRRRAEAAIPSTQQLTSWARQMTAAYALDAGATVDEAAWRAGCCDSAALRHLLRRHMLPCPKQLRATGALRQVVFAFCHRYGHAAIGVSTRVLADSSSIAVRQAPAAEADSR